MSELPIVGGLIVYEDAVKKPGEGDPQYWLSKKARVELRFDVTEGHVAEDVISLIQEQAQDRVAEMLGLQVAGKIAAPAPEAGAPAQTRTRRTKAQIEADKLAAQTPAADPEPVPDFPEAEAAASGGGPDAPQQSKPAEPPKADAPADTDDWDIPAETVVEERPPVTDSDLNAAVQKRNGELSAAHGEAGTVVIRKLIASFNPDPTKPFNLRQIAADKRHDFIDQLAKATVTA